MTSSTNVGTYELHWRRSGTGSPLLLLHGITDSSACWERILAELAGEYDMVATDARGHGRSSRWSAGMTNADMADDAAAVIRDVFGGPVAVWGHSMGAATATLLAARHPELVSAVVLEDPPYSAAPPTPGIDKGLVQMAANIRTMIAAVRGTDPADRLAVAAGFNPLWDAADLPGWVSSKLDFDLSVLEGSVIDRDWRTPMASVTSPVLLVVGDPAQGGAVTAETADALVSAHPDTLVKRFPVGHNVHREAYEDVLGVVREFLASHA